MAVLSLSTRSYLSELILIQYISIRRMQRMAMVLLLSASALQRDRKDSLMGTGCPTTSSNAILFITVE